MISDSFISDIEEARRTVQLEIRDWSNKLQLSEATYIKYFIEKYPLPIDNFVPYICKKLNEVYLDGYASLTVNYENFEIRYRNELLQNIINESTTLSDFIDKINNHPAKILKHEVIVHAGKFASPNKIEKVSKIIKVPIDQLSKFKRKEVKHRVILPTSELKNYFKILIDDKNSIKEICDEIISATGTNFKFITRILGLAYAPIFKGGKIRRSVAERLATNIEIDVDKLEKFIYRRYPVKEVEVKKPEEKWTTNNSSSNQIEPSETKNNNIEQMLLDMFRKIDDTKKLQVITFIHNI